jgi:DNA-3-methyladenine glycosylase
MNSAHQLPRSFYLRPTLEVAPDLLGKFLIFHSPQGKIVGEINEVEAYLGESDPASHAFRGPTPRTKVMFGEAGYSYVYFTYGMHYCLNVVTEETGVAGAVLIRSVIPREGVEIMQSHRRRPDLKNLTNGPGKLCQAYGLTRAHNGIDLVRSEQLYLQDRGVVPSSYQTSPRIGISQAKEQLWRFYYTVSDLLT